jgi:adenylate kinase
MAVHLKVPDSILVERVVGRRTCSKCGTIFHLKNNAPKVAGKCDKCGGELEQRTDDTAAVVEKRLATYHEQDRADRRPLRQEAGVLSELDGNRAPDAVYTDLKRIVTTKGAH